MGTLFKQLLDFNKDLIGVTPARLLMAQQNDGAATETEFHRQVEIVFNWLRDTMKSVSESVREDFARREVESRSEGPLARMDQVLKREIKPLQKHKYKT